MASDSTSHTTAGTAPGVPPERCPGGIARGTNDRLLVTFTRLVTLYVLPSRSTYSTTVLMPSSFGRVSNRHGVPGPSSSSLSSSQFLLPCRVVQLMTEAASLDAVGLSDG